MNIALADRQDNDVGDLLSRGGIRIPHLKLIVALDDYGQISAAASVMNMSQPAASRMLSEIETILELREAGREIRDLRSGTGGSVSIGAVTAPAAQIIIPAIRAVRTLFPRIHINLQVETSTELAKDLLASRLDFMLARIPDDMNPRQFEAREIGIERACLVVRHGHPLLQKPSVTLAELSDMEWVMQPPGSLLNRTVERLFLAASVPLPDRIVSTSSLLMTMLMVQASDAIAPMAADVASPFFAAGKQALAALPIGRDITVQPYSLITLRGRQLSPAAQTVCQAVIAEIDRQKA
jgi:DNA-binding transcriptional LysR family regulator